MEIRGPCHWTWASENSRRVGTAYRTYQGLSKIRSSTVLSRSQGFRGGGRRLIPGNLGAFQKSDSTFREWDVFWRALKRDTVLGYDRPHTGESYRLSFLSVLKR